MKIKFKKLHEDAVLPSYARPGDAGLDITTVSDSVSTNSGEDKSQWYYIEYKTGLAVELPEGYVGLLFPRSSISKSALILANSVGILDSGFRGEICFRFKVDAGIMAQAICDSHPAKYKKGDKIGQLVIIPYPTVKPEFGEELSKTERGEGGFGSTNEPKKEEVI